MAEIEEFLLHQLEDAIKKTDDDIQNTELFAPDLLKLFNIHDTCKELKALIEKMPPNAEDGLRREKLYYLNNVMADWQMLLTMHHHSTPGMLRSAMNLSQSLKQIKKELQDGKPGSVKGGKESRLKTDLETYGWSSPSVDPTQIHGVEDNVMIMKRLLVRKETKNGFRAIGIVGVAGVGKTALCKVAFNNQEVKKHFLPRIWVCLSKQPKEDTDYKKEVVERILTCLGTEDEIIAILNREGGLRKLLFALQQQLKGKRYLIVLDDVWNLEVGVQKFCSLLTQDENINPEQLAYGLSKGHGGTVIVTSRSREIAEDMVGEKNLHTLLPLADKMSCWKIFRDAVEKDGIVPPDMSGETNRHIPLPPADEESSWKFFRDAVYKEGFVPAEDREMLKDRILENCAKLPLVAKMKGQIVHERLLAQRENNQNQNQTQQETHQLEA